MTMTKKGFLSPHTAEKTVLCGLFLMNIAMTAAQYECTYSLTVGGTNGRRRWLDDTSNFRVAGGGTTTCTVSSAARCEYAALSITYGDDVGGSDSFNGASGSAGQVQGSTTTDCNFSFTMSDSNNALILGLSFDWISLGDVSISCSCDAPLATTSAPTGAPWVPPPDEAGSSNCFSESATVQVQHKGVVSMKDLQVGDKVLTGNKKNQYQQVYSFGHLHESLEGTFLQIYTDDKHNPLEITGGHLLFVMNDENQLQTVRADAIKVGDLIVQNKEDEHPISVTKVSTIQKKGVYMPLTPDGTIVVDRILASTYVSIQDEAPVVVGNSKFFPLLTEDRILHWFLAPYRMLCLGVSSNFCHLLENRNDEGIHSWLVAGRSLAEFANGQSFFVQVFLIGIPVFLLFATMNLLEFFLGGPSLAPFACLAAITTVGWIAKQRHMNWTHQGIKKLD